MTNIEKKQEETHLQVKHRLIRERKVIPFPTIEDAIKTILAKRPKGTTREKFIKKIRNGDVEIYRIRNENEFYVTFSDDKLKKIDYAEKEREKRERREIRGRKRDREYTLHYFG